MAAEPFPMQLDPLFLVPSQ